MKLAILPEGRYLSTDLRSQISWGCRAQPTAAREMRPLQALLKAKASTLSH